MGISGHMLGAKRLRALNAATSLDLDRAYRRSGYWEGRRVEDDRCVHYAGEWHHDQITVDCTVAGCWSSCDERLPGYMPPVQPTTMPAPGAPGADRVVSLPALGRVQPAFPRFQSGPRR